MGWTQVFWCRTGGYTLIGACGHEGLNAMSDNGFCFGFVSKFNQLPPQKVSHHALLHCPNVISYSRNLCLLPHPFTVHLGEETDCLLYNLPLSSRGQELLSPEYLLSQAGQT